jgi:hypothetical protein
MGAPIPPLLDMAVLTDAHTSRFQGLCDFSKPDQTFGDGAKFNRRRP